MRYLISVRVMPKSGISDPEGKAIYDAALQLGYGEARGIHAGRSFAVEGEYDSLDAARRSAEELAGRLLANPVIQSYEIISVEELP
ncbi:MAG: phosphoribosylformylglycinamidine synthase subunit PurS [Ferrimicrobium sp.]